MPNGRLARYVEAQKPPPKGKYYGTSFNARHDQRRRTLLDNFQTRYWNPQMKPFYFGARNGVHIINLEKLHLYSTKL